MTVTLLNYEYNWSTNLPTGQNLILSIYILHKIHTLRALCRMPGKNADATLIAPSKLTFTVFSIIAVVCHS